MTAGDYPNRAAPPVEPVDPDRLGGLLRLVESDAHRAGWDRPPSLLMVYDQRDTDLHAFMHRRLVLGDLPAPTRLGPYVAQALQPASTWAGGHPTRLLWNWCANLATPADRRSNLRPEIVDGLGLLLTVFRSPGWLGFAFVVESWGHRFATDEELVETNRTHRFADLPGSVECRTVHCVDRDGTYRAVMRVRGHKPELDGLREVGGHIPNSLRVVVTRIVDDTFDEELLCSDGVPADLPGRGGPRVQS